MRVLVGSTNPVKVRAVREVFEEYFEEVEVVGVGVESGVSEQPMSQEETRKGAENRARRALEMGGEYGVGLEGGVMEMEGVMYECAWVAIVKKSGEVGYGGGLYFELPPKVADKLRSGGELGPVMNELLSREDVKKKEGAIGVLSKGKLSRQGAYEQLVMQAILKFVSAEWWED